ncbi:MAG: hypothetical protein GY795_06165 [Desulfobacterales bacterium]|nr:hypothetical protein [Desulfobacterales bacterium]
MLTEILRDTFQLTGTEEGCGQGECGACTVLTDGISTVHACTRLLKQTANLRETC